MTNKKLIYCCGCGDSTEARLTDGGEIYPHRPDLKSLPFWKCDACGNHVGCHHKTSNPTHPLGNIPTPRLRKLRQEIHVVLDSAWKDGKMSRKEAYRRMSEKMGFKYHTANLKGEDEALKAYSAALDVALDD